MLLSCRFLAVLRAHMSFRAIANAST